MEYSFQMQEKLKACRSSKLNFLSSYLIVDYSHVKTVWLHVVVFSMIFCIPEIMYICLNIIQENNLKIALILSVSQISPVYKFPNFRLHMEL